MNLICWLFGHKAARIGRASAQIPEGELLSLFKRINHGYGRNFERLPDSYLSFARELEALHGIGDSRIHPGATAPAAKKCPHNWQNWVNHPDGTANPWCEVCCMNPRG